ncbi:MAG TPA: carboxypeptidase-like regulatory domain-containing protein, partial [Pyrinomonadaceae bacterium]|nr:carboxypeptidase-like regulatory domain-containing protein [Pyrinomonadaceae bacterium]
MKPCKSILLVSLTIFFSIFSVIAQAQDTGINLIIKNQLGEVIPDAEVTLVKGTQQISFLKSNKSGVVHFKKLDVGDYQVNIVAKGFNDHKSEIIKVSKGGTPTIEITLEILTIETDVMVGGNEGV